MPQFQRKSIPFICRGMNLTGAPEDVPDGQFRLLYNIRYYNGMAVTLRYNVMRWGPYSFGFGFQAELVTRLLDEGATFIEIPVAATHQKKAGGNSALNWKNFLSVGHTLLEILIRRVRKCAFKK